MATLDEKIKRAQEDSPNSPIISIAQKHKINISKLETKHIKHLDSIRAATREDAKQLKSAATGIALQSTFITASAALAVHHGLESDTLHALFQLSAASLATSPLKGVVNFAKDLHAAIDSHRATEAEYLIREVESEAGFEKPDFDIT